MRSRIGIREVAKAAGVSVTTVSHALNDVQGARVNEETRQRVLAVAADLNYAPNRLASGLRNLQSQTIGFISDEISTTPFAGKMILGAQHAAKKHGLLLIMINTDGDAQAEAQGIQALLQHQVDGIVYATMYHRRIQVPDSLKGIPAVLLDATSPEASLPSVVPDEFGGARAAMHELLAAGHRRIGFVSNQDAIPATAGRLDGVKAAFAGHGLPYDPALTVAAESSTDGGYTAAMQLLTLPARPTGLFCFNDQMAMGAYRAAAELGLKIPADLSVVGFDNLELISGFLHPRLTTVQLPHYEMGVWAINRLEEEIARAKDGPHEPLRTALDCPIVRRASVAPPPLL
ncbi:MULTISPECIES: LacI family DNA-binding transcriptional regulator [unclassified Arthrobacter]|uniref:LacI family DNA-binding transcriptional regulator n=1 Tax=unclassified Arthrobacter TaxID=235627 RepID=UPI00159DEAC9|nr:MULTISPECIES: LacI family DNA-binding transcriptional regulator [unclassified Arthrobacter]MCQ9165166.1 LacI family DNA-binding transcriptional regulator [Arthrobacter sp. STN4]NVM98100.1 substrate-binding domain-containing protein [Arthrobacter sp. SDTb3-6]